MTAARYRPVRRPYAGPGRVDRGRPAVETGAVAEVVIARRFCGPPAIARERRLRLRPGRGKLLHRRARVAEGDAAGRPPEQGGAGGRAAGVAPDDVVLVGRRRGSRRREDGPRRRERASGTARGRPP